MQKIQVTKINPTTLEVEILGTFSHYNDAIEFLHLHLDKEYKFDDWLKCYYGNHLTLGIYEYSRVFPKKLVAKYQLVYYLDTEGPNTVKK